MKKFIKWFFIIVGGLFFTILLVNIFTISNLADEIQVENNKITLSEPVNLDMNIIIDESGCDYIVSGNTNLPDSTKLAVSFNIDGNTKGQANAYTAFGKFEFNLNKKILSFDEIEISCYRNQFWQSQAVLKQLAFVNDIKKDECVKRVFSIKELKDKYFRKILDFNNTPDDIVDYKVEPKPVDYLNIKRTAINLYVNKTIDNDELKKCIKHCILKEIVKEPKTKAIVIKCFHEGENTTFRSNAVFAPYGEWAKANENVGFSKYKLKI